MGPVDGGAMTSRPIVLFVGDDASSTQIAESLLRRLVGDRVEIHTAGAQPPNPGGREDQMLVMMGLNPAHEERLSVRALATSDRVIVLGTSLDVARSPVDITRNGISTTAASKTTSKPSPPS